MSTSSRPPPRVHRRLGEALVTEDGVARSAIDAALAQQTPGGRRLGELLVASAVIDSEALARALARQLAVPYAPGPLRPSRPALDLVGPALARARRLMPLEAGDRWIRIAVSDPLDVDAVEDVRFRAGRRVEIVVASPGSVLDAQREAFGDGVEDLLASLPTAHRDDSREALERQASSAPVVRLVDRLVRDAVERRASDVHLEGGDADVGVRIRVDGVLRMLCELPGSTRSAVVSRIKIMAGMDIAEKRRPQDGGFRLRHGGADLTARVSSLPVDGGEKLVLRLLDPARVPEGLDALGLASADLVRVRRLLEARQGLVLAAGPTGSGKSTTLFGALAEVDRVKENVVSLEDPIEYRIPGVSQVQLHAAAGLTFATALRSVLRQDPDVVMVGEIRDRETAEIAMSAAITGHLVLSSIHTVDAPSAIGRLLDMGVPPYLIAGGLTGVVAQRLVRTLCRHCRGRGTACGRCNEGYRDRSGVFQVLAVTDAIRDEVMRGSSTSVIRRLARGAGMTTLVDDARRKVAEGETTPHEVARVLRADPGASTPCRHCERDVPTGAEACPHCGRRLSSRCACGASLRSWWRFCPSCVRPVVVEEA